MIAPPNTPAAGASRSSTSPAPLDLGNSVRLGASGLDGRRRSHSWTTDERKCTHDSSLQASPPPQSPPRLCYHSRDDSSAASGDNNHSVAALEQRGTQSAKTRRVHFASTLQREHRYNPGMLVARIHGRDSGSNAISSGQNHDREIRSRHAPRTPDVSTTAKYRATRAARRLALQHVAKTDVSSDTTSSSTSTPNLTIHFTADHERRDRVAPMLAWNIRDNTPTQSRFPVLNGALEHEMSHRSRHCTIC